MKLFSAAHAVPAKTPAFFFEELEDRILYSATPVATVSAPADVKIGEDFQITVGFDNADANTTGYGPIIDLAIDTTGKDGAAAEVDDGISVAASGAVKYLGTNANYTKLTFDDTANGGLGILHPYAKDNTGNFKYVKTTDYGAAGTFENGDTLLVIELPFGSFTPNQPVANITVDATLSGLADLGTGLTTASKGLFRFGDTATEDWATDPSLVGALSTATVTPSVFTVSKSYIGPENETATGPNFVRKYRISADIASGQTISSLTLADMLPGLAGDGVNDAMQFVAITGSSHAYTATSTPSTSDPGGKLEVTFTPSITGTTAGEDAWLEFSFFVPRMDTDTNVILDASTGDDNNHENQAYGYGTWDPTDTRDSDVRTFSLATGDTNPLNPANAVANAAVEHTLEAQSIAIQKSSIIQTNTGAAGYTPGDTIEVTLDFQISDYFAFKDLMVIDEFSDGLKLDWTYTPTLTWTAPGTGTTTVAVFDSANWIMKVLGNGGSGHLAVIGNGGADATEYTTNLGSVVGDNTSGSGDPAGVKEGGRQLTFEISDELITRAWNGDGVAGADGVLRGGGVDVPFAVLHNNTVPVAPGTTGQIKYRMVITDKFAEYFPSGENAVNGRDVLENDVIITGSVLNTADLSDTGNDEADDSDESYTIVSGALTKSIFAINGNTTVPATVYVSPGDTVTYRFTYTLPSGDVEDLVLRDFLPLPIFNAADPDQNGVNNAWTFTDTVYSGPGDLPAAGFLIYGASDTLGNAIGAAFTPTITTVTTNGNNTLLVTYGDYSNTANTTLTADVLFTVTVGDDPFADGLYLTNQVQSGEVYTQGPAVEANANSIIQVILSQPELAIYKGVVGYAATGLTLGGANGITFTAPNVGSDFSNAGTGASKVNTNADAKGVGDSDIATTAYVDAGDKVRFGIVIENTGGGDAFDVVFSDTVLGAYVDPGATANDFITSSGLTVRQGDGTLLALTTDYTVAWDDATNKFTITLVDNGSGSDDGAINKGRVGATDTSDGSNYIVVTYDLTLDTDAQAKSTLTNTASLEEYTNKDGSTEKFLPGTTTLTDTAKVLVKAPTMTKVLTGTEINNANNSNTQAVVGELVTYTMTVTVPEGTTAAAQIVDTMDSGLTFYDIVSVTNSAGVSSANVIGTGTTPGNVTLGGAGNDAGKNLTFNFGDITNTNADDATAETITIVYRAVVINTSSSPNIQTGTNLNNSAVFSHQYTDQPTGSAQTNTLAAVSAANVTVIEPTLTIATTMADASGGGGSPGSFGTTLTSDAGDTVYHRIVITNANGANDRDAFDLALADTFNGVFTGLSVYSVSSSGTVTVTDSGGNTLDATDFSIAGQVLSIAGASNIDMAKNSTITLILTSTTAQALVPHNTYSNQATVTWTSMDGVVSNRSASNGNSADNERTGADGVGGALNDYAAQASATLTGTSYGMTKSIVSTSSSDTAGTNVVIGEVVRYQIVLTIPEGTSANLMIRDNLPAGLKFLDDETATITFSADTGFTFTANGGVPDLDGGGAALTNQTLTLTNAAYDAVISKSNNTATDDDSYVADNDPYFRLGDVINTDSDANAETITIEFNAVVVNVAGNQEGTTLNNTATVRQGGTDRTTSAGVAVTVREPVVTIAKTADAAAADAGDDITYTIKITNSGSYWAYDLSLSDVIDALVTSPTILSGTDFTSSGTIHVTDGGANTLDVSDFTMTGQTLGLTAGRNIDMAAGSWIEMKVKGTLANTVSSGQSISNTATTTWTSLDDDQANDGSDTDERTGAGGINDYTASSSVVTTAVSNPTVTKVLVGSGDQAYTIGTDAAVGETFSYTITVTLAEGVTSNLTILDIAQDDASAALEIVSAQITALGANLSGGNIGVTMTVGANGTLTSPGTSTLNNQASFDFGNITNTSDNVSDAKDQIVITVTARVPNLTVNQAADTLSNTGRVTYGAGGASVVNSASTSLTVVEPVLQIDKSFTTATTNIDAGDTVTYKIVVFHTAGSNQNAYDLILSDTLPTDLESYTLDSAIITDGAGGAADTNVAGSLSLVGGVLSTTGNIDLLRSTGGALTHEQLEITITGKVKDATVVGTTVNNTATAKWSSLDGGKDGDDAGDTTERTGSDGTSDPNNYTVTDSASFATVGALDVTKAVNVATATIGDTVTYTVTVTVAEGQTVVNLTDVLPAGLTLVANSVAIGSNPAAMTITGLNNNSLTQTLTITNNGGSNGTVNNAASTETDSFTITYQALVTDVATNDGITAAGDGDGQTSLVNDVDASAILNNDGDTTDPGETDNNNTATVTVIEPKLVITKTNNDADGVVNRGQVVTYTLTIENLGANGSTADAFDIRVRDLVPANLTNVTFVSATGATVTHNATAGNTLDLTLDTLALGATATVTFTAKVDTAVAGGTTIDNNAKIFWDNRATDEGSTPGTGNTVFGEVDGASGDRDYGSTGVDEAHNVNTLNEQDTDRITVGSYTLGDYVWMDTDADGVQDAAEGGIGGVTVTLLYAGIDGDFTTAGDNITFATTTTTAAGAYSFGALAPGQYRVTTSGLALDATQTYDADGTGTANRADFTIVAANITNADFGYRGTGSIGDLVWHDIDGGATQNGSEKGIGGVTIDLYRDVDSSGTVNAGDVQVGTQTTDVNGAYDFTGLLAGTYLVDVTDTGNKLASTTLTGAAGVTDPEQVVLAAAQDYNTADFGYRGSAALGDRVWNDTDSDGVQDAGEVGVTGLTVNLYRDLNHDGDYADAGEGQIASTTTGANGSYSFTNLIAGNYIVVVTAPGSSTNTYDKDDYAATATNHTANVTLGAAETDNAVDFGYVGTLSISDFVWFDADSDGIQDGSEPGVAGVRVFLDMNGNGTYEAATETAATTNALGIYSIGNLVGGNYTVRVDTSTLPAGYVATSDRDGAGSADVTTFNLVASLTDVDFGYRGTNSISGRSYHDWDKNSTFDGSDTGLGGVTIDLISDTDNDGVVDAGELTVLTATTAADGTYTFANVIAGNYLVRETQLSGYGESQNATNLIDVTMAAVPITGQNFGNTTGSLAGRVFRDDDDSGAQNGAEPGIAGVTVTLTWSGGDGIFGTGDDKTATVLTNAAGDYLFDYANTAGFVANGDSTRGLLSSGSYRIAETQPGSYLDGADAVGNAATAPGSVTAGTESAAWLAANPASGTGRGADNLTGIRIGVAQDATGYNFGELSPSSITGSVYADNGNGVRDAGEAGIPAVTINLTGNDKYGRAVSLTASTDANGDFSFTNLFASDAAGYTLTQPLQPAGYTDGLEAAGTAGGVANIENIAGIVLGMGVNSTANTFGEIVIPPVIPVPPAPVPVSAPATGGLTSFTYSVFHNDADAADPTRENESFRQFFIPPERGIIPQRAPLLPLAPLYSGKADPGSTLVVTMIGSLGQMLGTQTVVADVGGNWLATMPSVTLTDYPRSIVISQQASSFNTGAGSAYNLRTYYAPALQPGEFFMESLDVGSIFGKRSPQSVMVLFDFLENPVRPDWTAHGAEFVAAQATSAGY